MKKFVAVTAVLLFGFLLFGCTQGGQQATIQPTGIAQPTQQIQPSQTQSTEPTASPGIVLTETDCKNLVSEEDVTAAGFTISGEELQRMLQGARIIWTTRCSIPLSMDPYIIAVDVARNTDQKICMCLASRGNRKA